MNNMVMNKNKKYIIGIIFLVAIIGLISVLSFGNFNTKSNNVNVKKISTKTNSLSANVSNTEDNEVTSNAFDTIEYDVEYQLEARENIDKTNVILNATLSEEESKYAGFVDITNYNIESTLTNNGKSINVKINDVKTGIKRHIKLKLKIENAPSNFKINPVIKIKEETENNFTNVLAKEVTVITNSVEGYVTDDNDNPVSNIELSILKNGEEVRKTVTDTDGFYIFSGLDEDNYEIKINEDIYKSKDQNIVAVKNNKIYDFKVESTKPYEIDTKKYINEVKLVINGKEEIYKYGEIEKVIEVVKNIKEIKGEITYKIKVKNNGEVSGDVTVIKDYLDDGLSFDSEKNKGWEKEGKYLYYRPFENVTLNSNEQKEVTLKLDIKKTKEAKNYLNRINAKGEIYKKVVFILDGSIYKEEKVIEGEKIKQPEVENENFDGWYIDKKQTIKYNFNTEVDKDLILYGTTDNKKEYTVTFIDNDEIYKEQTVKMNQKVTTVENPTKEGHRFKYWSLTENGEAFDFNTLITRNITLYSVYETVDYNVLFLDGETIYDNQKVGYNELITVPASPEKQYFTFKYWSLTEDGEEYDLNTPVTSDVTLHSVYEKNKYTYTLIDKGEVIKQQEVEAGTLMVIPEVSKEGYTFKYWSNNENDDEYNILIPVTSDVVLHSVYEINKYKVSFYDNDQKIKDVEVEYNNQIDSSEIPEVTKTGYNFLRWNDENENAFDFTTPITKNVKLYSKYQKQKKAVTFNDENRITSVEIEYGDTVNPIDNQGKTGYTFKHWSESINGEAYNFSTVITEPKTLYAVYEINKYTVTFINEGNVYETQNVDYNSYLQPFNSPTKEGYTFTKWTKENETQAFDTTSPITENITVYSNYEIINYSISYTLNGGDYENNLTNKTTYNVETDTFTLIEPVKQGYNFLGWTGSNGSQPQKNITIEKGSTGNKNYTAIYEKSVFTVTFINEGNVYETQEVNFNEKASLPENEPSKTGYTFKHWSVLGTTTAYDFDSLITEDLTLISNYEINTYTVTFMDGENIYLNKTVNYNEKVTPPTINPVKSHYIFKGWTLNNENFDFDTQITENITLNSSYEKVNAPTISANPTTWTKNNVTVTITGDNENNEYYYSIDGGENTLYNGPISIEQNCTVSTFAKRENVISEEVSVDIDNIDKIKPNIDEDDIVISELKPSSFTINASSNDDQSGLGRIEVYLDNQELFTQGYNDNSTETKEVQVSPNSLEEETTYTVKVISYDAVGNYREVTKEVTTPKKIIVAKIIGRNNTIYEDSSLYEQYESLQEAIDDCSNNQCTIQMVLDVTESVTVRANQDVTLDINGKTIDSLSNQTITNNGKLIIKDNGETSGVIENDIESAIVNNGILTLGENETELEVSKTTPYIKGTTTGIKNNNIFNFYDGKIEGTLAIDGEVTETPFKYNAGVEGTDPQIATLTILANAVARINSTYYTELQTAIDESKIGNYSNELVDLNDILKYPKSNESNSFLYDENTNKLINGNSNSGSATSSSYVIIDLTNYDEDQMVDVTATLNKNVTQYNKYENNIGYVYLTESSDTPTTSSSDVILKMKNNGTENALVYLEKGKKYYLHFQYVRSDTSVYNDYFTIDNIEFTKATEKDITDATVYSNLYNPFVKLDNGKISSTSNIKDNSSGYIAIDLRNTTKQKSIIINTTRTSTAWTIDKLTVTDSPNIPSNYQIEFGWGSPHVDKDSYLSLTPGIINYVHFYKEANDNSGEFVINSIKFADETDDYEFDKNSIVSDETNNFKWNDSYDLYDIANDNTLEKVNIKGISSDGAGMDFAYGNYISLGQINNPNFTYEVRFKTDDVTKYQSIISNANSGGADIYIQNGKIVIEAYIGGSYKTITSSSISNDTEYTATLSWDGSNLSLYLNGELVQSDPYSGNLGYPTNNTVVMLGSEPDGTTPDYGYQFYGTIYSARIYSKGLTSEEVSINYQKDLNYYTTKNKVDTVNGYVTDGLVFEYEGVSNSNINNEGTILSNNNSANYTNAHSYIPFDLSSSSKDLLLKIDTSVYLANSVAKGYISVTDNTNTPFSGSSCSASNLQTICTNSYAKEDATYFLKLTKGQVNYVHFGFYRYNNEDYFRINNISIMDEKNELKLFGEKDNTNKVKSNEVVLNSNVDRVELLTDLTINSSMQVTDTRDVILDLNGYSLTTSSNGPVIENKGSLKIVDSKYESQVTDSVLAYQNEQQQYDDEYEEAMLEYNSKIESFLEYMNSNDFDETLYAKTGDTYTFEDAENFVKSLNNEFNYTGGIQTFTAPYSGYYKLEVWGASGGSLPSSSSYEYFGGYGGYSKGVVHLQKDETVYIVVGGQGSFSSANNLPGGYNGGGATGVYDSGQGMGSGGGATHIARSTGVLADLEDNKNDVLIVAGGGGGGCYNDQGISPGGGGGGASGVTATTQYGGCIENQSTCNGYGGTQTAGGPIGVHTYTYTASAGSFGLGGGNSDKMGAGGGAGWYGASGALWYGASGGSGYIGNDTLDDKYMVCYDCSTSNDEDTKTISNENVSENAVENYSKIGNGYAKISIANISLPEQYSYIKTITKPTLQHAVLNTDYTVYGSINGTTNSTIINDSNAYLNVDSANLNLEKTGEYAIIDNYGSLKLSQAATLTTKANNNRGIINRETGDILDSKGTINTTSSNNIGLLNYSRIDSEMKGLNISNTISSSTNIDNQSLTDLSLKEITTDGPGTDVYQKSDKLLTIFESTLGNTSNNVLKYANNNDTHRKVTINKSTIKGVLCNNENCNNTYDNINTELTINNSTLTSTTNNVIYMGKDNSKLNIISSDLSASASNVKVKFGDILIKDSTLEGPTSNNSYEFNIYSPDFSGYESGIKNIELDNVNLIGNRNIDYEIQSSTDSSLLIKNSDIKCVNCYYSLNLDNYLENSPVVIKDTNITSDSGNTIYINDLNHNIYIDILGNTTINTTNGYSIYSGSDNHDVVVNFGDKDSDVNLNYPKIISNKSAVGGTSKLFFNYYDGTITGIKDKVFVAPINEIRQNYDINVTKGETLDTISLKDITDTNSTDYVAKIGNTKYTTLQNAINGASNNDTITLLKDIYTATDVNNSKNVTIDSDSYNIKTFKKNNYLINSGNLTLTDSNSTKGSISGYTSDLITNNGTIDFNNITMNLSAFAITGDWTQSGPTNGFVNNGTLNLNSGTITSEFDTNLITNNSLVNIVGTNISDSNYTSSIDLIKNNENATMNVSNGSIIKTCGGNIFANNGTLNISGGTYKTSECYLGNTRAARVVKNSTSGIVDISGGTYTNVASAIVESSGETTIRDLTSIDIPTLLINTGTATIDNVTTSNTKNNYIYNKSSGNMTIKNSTINSPYTPLYLSETSNTTIENGSIISGNYSNAISLSNSAKLTLGIKGDKNLDNSLKFSNEYPLIKSNATSGNCYGIYSNSSDTIIDFYDGKVVGPTAIVGTINDIENGYNIKSEINGNVESKYLSDDPIIKNIEKNKSYTDIQTAINEVENNQTLQVLSEITILKTAEVLTVGSTKNFKFDLNGNTIYQNNENFINNAGTIEFIDSSVTQEDTIGQGLIYNYSTSKMIINSGNITFTAGNYKLKYNGNIIDNSGTVYVNNGLLTTEAHAKLIINSGTLNITGGEIKTNYTSYDLIENKAGASINMTGGSITDSGYRESTSSVINNSGNVTISDGTIKVNGGYMYDRSINHMIVITNNSSGIVRITGGTFTSDDNKGKIIVNNGDAEISNISTNYMSVGNNTDQLTLTNVNMTDIGYYSTRYADNSIPALINSGTLTINGGTYTIHRNNRDIFKLTNSSSNTISGLTVNTDGTNYGTQPFIEITGSSTLDLKNSSFTSDQNLYGMTISTSGNVDIDDVSISTNYNALNAQGTGIINITNSTLTSNNQIGLNVTNSQTINIGVKDDYKLDGTRNLSITSPAITGATYGIYNNNSNSNVNFYDGIIKGPENKAVYGAIKDVETGYNITSTTTDNIESKYLDRVYVVENLTTHEKYYDLQSAVTAAGLNEKLQVINNITIMPSDTAVDISNTKKITLDLNGYTISQNNSKLIENNGDLTIEDSNNTGNINSPLGDIIDNNNKLTINSGTFKVMDSSNYIIKNNKDLYINGGTFTSQTGATLIKNNDKAYITDGSFVDPTVFDTNYVIENSSTGELNISGGEFNKDYSEQSIFNNSGILNIEGGTFSLLSYLNGWDCPRMVTNQSTGTLDITGGTFTGDEYSLLIGNYGTATIKDITTSLLQIGNNYSGGSLTLTNYVMTTSNDSIRTVISNSGDLTVNSSTFLGHNIISGCGTDIKKATYEINNSSFTDNQSSSSSSSSIIAIWGNSTSEFNNVTMTSNASLSKLIELSNSNNTLDINGGTYTYTESYPLFIIGSGSTLSIDNATFNASDKVFDIITSNGSNGIFNIIDGTFTSDNSEVIKVADGAKMTINIGESGLPINNTPILTGKTYAINNQSNVSTINIYDGTLIGETNSIIGAYNSESGYKLVTTDQDIGGVTKKVGNLEIVGTTERVASVNNLNFTDLQAAVNTAANLNVDVILYKNVILDSDLTVPAGKTVTINVGNYTITKGSYTIDSGISLVDGNGNPVSSAIYKFIADIMGIEVNPKNISIYMMDDGSKLSSEETYKLYKDDKLVSFEEIEIGKYRLGNIISDLRTVNNRLYIQGLGEGNYKLTSTDNKQITFSISNDKIYGNVREYTINNENKKESSSIAEYSIQIQTGINKISYALLIFSIIAAITSLIVLKKKKA